MEVYSETLKALQSTTSTRRTLVVQLWPLCQVKYPTMLGKPRKHHKHLQTPNHNPQSKRDPSEMQQKRADIQKIGN